MIEVNQWVVLALIAALSIWHLYIGYQIGFNEAETHYRKIIYEKAETIVKLEKYIQRLKNAIKRS